MTGYCNRCSNKQVTIGHQIAREQKRRDAELDATLASIVSPATSCIGIRHSVLTYSDQDEQRCTLLASGTGV